MRLDVEIKGTDVQFGKIVQIDFGGGSLPGGTSYPLSYSENEDHTVNLISGGTTIVSNLVTLEALQEMDLGSGSGSGMDVYSYSQLAGDTNPYNAETLTDTFNAHAIWEINNRLTALEEAAVLNFDKVFEIQYDADGVTPLSIKAKYDLWSVGSVSAGGLGTTEGGTVVDPGTGEGTTVSYGEEGEGQYVPLTVAETTKNISLSSHTHDYSLIYAEKVHDHDDTYREKTDNLFIDGIILKKGDLQTAISIDDAGNIYVSGNFYATGSVSAGGPGGEGSAPVASVVSWGETQEAGYGLLKVRENDEGTYVALDSHTHDYAASTHPHTWSDISDAPESMPASDVHDWAKAATKPSYSYSEIVGAAEHNHNTSYSKAIFGEEANGGVPLTLYNGALQLPAAKNLRLHNSGDFSNISAGLTATKLTLKYSSSISTALKIDANGNIYVEGNFYATGSIAAGAAGSIPTYATMGQVDAAIASAISELNTGGSGTTVSWGTTTSEYSTLNVGGTEKNVSLSGHTHTGYATETYVQNAISELGGGDPVDLTDYATKAYVTTALEDYSLLTHDHDDDYLSITGGTLEGDLALEGDLTLTGILIGGYASFANMKATTFRVQHNSSDLAPVSITKDANGNIVINGNLHATGSLSSGGVGVLGATQATRAGSVTSAGIETEIIGTFTVLYSSINKEYTITHNLGKTDYVCTPVIKDPATAVKVYVKDKTTNSIKVIFEDNAGTKVANAFDFIIV